MKRLLILIIISILFSSLINVILTLNTISVRHDVFKIVNTTQSTLNASLNNQKIIMDNQKQIFAYSQNVTNQNMQELKDIINNATLHIEKNLTK